MSASSGGDNGQDFDLNLAPIIDCFTVLITYLLVSASFLTVTMLEVGVAAVGQSSSTSEGPKEPPLSLTVTLQSTKEVTLKLVGGIEGLNQEFRVPASRERTWDIAALSAKLKELKRRWPKIPDVTLGAEASVSYKDVVKLVEATKAVVPKIFLAGN